MSALTRTMLAVLVILAGRPAGAQERVPAFHFLGFTDFNVVEAIGSQGSDTDEGFRHGQAVLHVSGRLIDRFSVFGEVSATATPAGFRVEVERSLLRYDIRDALKLSAGRFHTPLGYWNTAFHHGQWLQASIDRPRMVAFGTPVIPIHFVGVVAEGALSLDGLGLHYAAGIGNGRGEDPARAGDAGDVNDHRATVISLRVRPAALRGVEAGVATYADRVSQAALEIDERIWAVHAVWDRGPLEAIVEYAAGRHGPAGGPGAPAVEMGYAQLGWRGSRVLADAMLYARYERIDIPPDDPLLGGRGLEYEAVLGGVRYDFAPMVALKAEYRREQAGGGDWRHVVGVQAAIVLPSWHLAGEQQ